MPIMDVNWFSYYILCLLSLSISSLMSQICDSRDGIVCCSGYVWNEVENNCTRCMDGYYGRNCAVPCSPPYFGWNCRSTCNCSKEDCHHIYGCRKNPSECETGRYGDYCELPCRYPGYGKECQFFCSCDEVFCDVFSGCAGLFYSRGPKAYCYTI